jgi:hypothetical protein
LIYNNKTNNNHRQINQLNNTPYTLKLKSKTAAHGSWTVLPPSTITPSEKGVFFCMKDPSIAAAGSEGTVTYHAIYVERFDIGK